MYGMSGYLLVMHEGEKARLLARQESERCEKEEPSLIGSPLEGHKRMSERKKGWRRLLLHRKRQDRRPDNPLHH
jgi:hypothetical protein